MPKNFWICEPRYNGINSQKQVEKGKENTLPKNDTNMAISHIFSPEIW